MDGLPFSVEEVTVSHVVVAGGQQRALNIQINPEAIVKAFSPYGVGVFVPVPNGFIVQMGPTNQLLFQPPRIEFKAATDDILRALYRNSQPTVLEPLMTDTAQAFGVNFEVHVSFPNLKPGELLAKLATGFLKHVAITRIGFRRQGEAPGIQMNYDLHLDGEQLVMVINRHMEGPWRQCIGEAELLHEVTTARQEYRKFIGELLESTQTQN